MMKEKEKSTGFRNDDLSKYIGQFEYFNGDHVLSIEEFSIAQNNCFLVKYDRYQIKLLYGYPLVSPEYNSYLSIFDTNYDDKYYYVVFRVVGSNRVFEMQSDQYNSYCFAEFIDNLQWYYLSLNSSLPIVNLVDVSGVSRIKRHFCLSSFLDVKSYNLAETEAKYTVALENVLVKNAYSVMFEKYIDLRKKRVGFRRELTKEAKIFTINKLEGEVFFTTLFLMNKLFYYPVFEIDRTYEQYEICEMLIGGVDLEWWSKDGVGIVVGAADYEERVCEMILENYRKIGVLSSFYLNDIIRKCEGVAEDFITQDKFFTLLDGLVEFDMDWRERSNDPMNEPWVHKEHVISDLASSNNYQRDTMLQYRMDLFLNCLADFVAGLVSE